MALNQVNLNDGDGIGIRSTGTLVNLSNVYIQGNAIEDNGKDGVHVESTLEGTVSNLNVSPFFALNRHNVNRIKSNGRINEGAGDGIEIESGTDSNFSNVVIQSNTLISNKGYGVRINGADSTTIQGNYIGYKPADGSLLGNVMGGVLLTGNADDTGADDNVVTQNLIADSGSENRNSPDILIDDKDCEQNLLANNTFQANRGEPVVLHSDSQGGLGDTTATPVLGELTRNQGAWNIPITIDPGVDFAGRQCAIWFYTYDEALDRLEPYGATSVYADPVTGEIDVTVAIPFGAIPNDSTIRVSAYCSDMSDLTLLRNTTAFSNAKALPTFVIDEYVFHNNSGWDDWEELDQNIDDDPTNDVAIDEKFWNKLYKALGLTYSA